VKILMSVGGWTFSQNFSDVARTPEARERFARSCVAFMERHGFDGIDLDWEYPGGDGWDGATCRQGADPCTPEQKRERAVRAGDQVTFHHLEPGACVSCRDEDGANYVRLLASLRDALGERLLTAAVGAGPHIRDRMDVAGMARHVDWLSLMTYDFHGAWDAQTGFNAPLETDDGSGFSIRDSVDGYLEAGLPADKLVMGTAFYGRGWVQVPNAAPGAQGQAPAGVVDNQSGLVRDNGVVTGTWEPGYWTWRLIREHYLTPESGYVRGWDERAASPYLYSPEDRVWIGYDDPRSIRMKAAWARERGLRGVMTWEIPDDDCEDSLARALNEGFGRAVADPPAPCAGLPPIDEEVEPPHDDIERLLRLAVRFYGAQRCGDADNWLIADHPLGGRCHLQDGPGVGEGVDLTGGWHDAGDHIKQTATIAYAVYALAKAYEAFPEGFGDDDDDAFGGRADGVPDVIGELKVGADYLTRVLVGDELVTLVGDETDHLTFVTAPFQSTLDEDQGGGVRAVDTSGRGDVADLAAAGLAAAARVVLDEEAARYLVSARALHAFAVDHPGITEGAFYEDDAWEDNAFCAAAELAVTTGEAPYLAEALGHAATIGPREWAVSWYSPSDFARHTLAAAGEGGALMDDWRADLELYRARVSNLEHVRGMAWFYDWGSLAPATASAFGAALFHHVSGDAAAADFALSQLDYVMGDNEYDRSFVTGWGPNPPTRPHHATAYGHDDLDWDLSREFLRPLPGALVGGPTSEAFDVTEAGYADDINDYIGNEVTLDYNAGLVGLAAFALAPRARPPEPPPGEGGLGELLPEPLFRQLFPTLYGDPIDFGDWDFEDPSHGAGLLTYEAFLEAAAAYPGFATTGSRHDRVRELAAFLANISHETTGGWGEFALGSNRYRFGLFFVEEVGCEDGGCDGYCDPQPPWGWACALGRTYHGRGPMQLSWNYNYGLMSQRLDIRGPDGEADGLLHDPDLLLRDGALSFRSALWFWMTEQLPKPSGHDVMTGVWQPGAADLAAGRGLGFGTTVDIINGGIECGHGHDDTASDRAGFYLTYLGVLGGTDDQGRLHVSPRVRGSDQDGAHPPGDPAAPDPNDAVSCGAMQPF